MLGFGVAGLALEQAIPLGRVWSFPKEIVIAPAAGNVFLRTDWISMESLRILKKSWRLTEYFNADWEKFRHPILLDQRVSVRFPPRRLPD